MRILVTVALVSALVAGCKKEEAKAPAVGVAPVTAPGAAPGPLPGMQAAAPTAPGMPNDLGQALANLQKMGQQFGKQPGPGGNPQNPGAALSQAMAQLGQAMGGAGAAGQPAAPVVNWKALEPFAPEKLGDWTGQGELQGETTAAMGMQMSRVKRTYKKGDGTLSLEIIDTNASPIMRMGVNMAASLNIDGSDGVKKGITVNGNKGLLDWKKTGSGKLTLLVGDRFLVSLRLRPAASVDEVQAVGNLVNTAGLAAVK